MLTPLEYMHSQGWAHLDLKLENLLVTDDMHLKLTDMGFSLNKRAEVIGLNENNTSVKVTECKGTHTYMAPEIERIAALNKKISH